MRRFALMLPAVLLFSGCSDGISDEAPPRVTTPVTIEAVPSHIAVPVTAQLDTLADALERAIPKQLWSIDKPGQTCAAPKQVDLGIAKVKTPAIKCRIVGTVTRSALRLSGAGQDIIVAIPLHAVVRAEDIGGIIARETATADAMARAVIRLDLRQDWTPQGKVDLRYDWTDAPHVEFLGQRIEFADQADAKLKPVIARLERDLPAELRKLGIRQEIEKGWRSAFTVLSLNRDNPPVWMRVRPRSLEYGGYAIEGRTLSLKLGMTATTESFVGDRPGAPKPSALPPMARASGATGRVAFAIPVIADHRQLEPVLMRALVKRSARPFDIPGIGDVQASFKDVTIYGTEDEQIAVGIEFAAHRTGSGETPTSGTVWLTCKPVTETNSRRVQIADLVVSGTTDMTGGDLIIDLANAPGVTQFIAASLAQNFQNDFDELLVKVRQAIATTRQGDFAISADIDRVRTGRIVATGQGLFLPTRIEGTARVSLR